MSYMARMPFIKIGLNTLSSPCYVLAASLMLITSQSHAWYENYASCVEDVQFNCKYSDFYMGSGFSNHLSHAYPTYDQCVSAGIQEEGCSAYSNKKSSVTDVVVIGTPEPVFTGPIIIQQPFYPGDMLVPIAGGAQSPSRNSDKEEKEREQERRECQSDAELILSLCVEDAEHKRLYRFDTCENISWISWGLAALTRGLIGQFPETCMQKAEIEKDLAIAQCRVNREANFQLCDY